MRTALKKNLLLALILLTLITLPIVNVIYAQATTPTTPATQTAPATTSSGGGLKWNAFFQTSYSVDTIMHTTLCVLAGPVTGEVTKIPCTGTTPPTAMGEAPKVVALDPRQNGGVINTLAFLTGSLYDAKPISSTAYIASIGKEFGISPAYAQVSGSGAGIIEPVLILWQVLRNFAYMMFILVFITIGFMIMLKQKLNPQTVISVQSALPGLVIGLILVTFSYFISALIVDLSFLGVQLVTQVFASVLKPGTTEVMSVLGNRDDLLKLAQESSILTMLGSSLWGLGGTGVNIGKTLIDTQNSIPGTLFTTGFLGGLITYLMFFTINSGGALALIGAGTIAGATIPFIAALLVPLILIIALIIQMMKLFFKLLRCYITILVMTAASPLLILISTLPGKGGSVTFWWKTILANSLVFPAVFAVFLFAGMILATESWAATPPLFGNLAIGFVKILVAYALLLGLPAVPDMVKNALGVKDMSGIPEVAQAGFMTAFGIGRSATMKGAQQTEAYRQYQMGKKYREARINRDSQLDRYDEAATLEQRRRAAGQMRGASGFANRLYNRAFFRNLPGNDEPIYVNQAGDDGRNLTQAEAAEETRIQNLRRDRRAAEVQAEALRRARRRP